MPRPRHIGVLAPRLVAAGLVELLRTDLWDPFVWREDERAPAALVAWCREDDPGDLARRLARRARCPLIVISHLDSSVRSSPFVRAGGRSTRFLDLHVAPDVLRRHVGEVVETRSSSVRSAMKVPELSMRETDVLVLMSHGMTNGEIATKLFLGRESVKSHVAAILRKTGQPDRRRAAQFCADHGLIAHRLGS